MGQGSVERLRAGRRVEKTQPAGDKALGSVWRAGPRSVFLGERCGRPEGQRYGSSWWRRESRECRVRARVLVLVGERPRVEERAAAQYATLSAAGGWSFRANLNGPACVMASAW